ncbi:MAG: 50S ribosomal protein L6 [Myxococcota bacterium]
MSRIGNLPIEIPQKVKVGIKGPTVKVEGPLGTLERTFRGVKFSADAKAVKVEPVDQSRHARALWGLSRTLLSNMVVGVSKGFERVLEINGVGYRAEVKGQELTLTLGKSHPVIFELPKGIKAEVDKQIVLKLTGVDKELLGQTAAKIRSFRPPEPYKGKGVKYQEETIRRKAGKAAK